jgi:hypothetical protein
MTAPLLLCLIAAMFSRPAAAQTTLNLSDCSQSSLQTEWNAMSSGAYVLVFSSCAAGGTGTWTTGLSLSVPANVTSVTIEGATTVSCTGTAGTSSYDCTATDNTVIEDAYQSTLPILVINAGNATVRVTGLTIEGGNVGSSSNIKYNPASVVIESSGSSTLRIDDNHWNHNTYSPSLSQGNWIDFQGCGRGVADHNVLDAGNQTDVANVFKVENNCDDNIGYGDGSFFTATNFGSSDFFFIESNQFNGGSPVDCSSGSRVVYRYNTINNTFLAFVQHGTLYGTTGNNRGCRAEEVYHNYIEGGNSSPAFTVGEVRNATGLVWGNIVASGFSDFFQAFVDRSCGSAGASCALGNGGGDLPTPDGWGLCGTGPNGTGSNWDGNTSTVTGYPCLDGFGRGYDVQHLNGQQFIPGSSTGRLNSATGTIAWPQQYLEPWYLWDNQFTDAYGTACNYDSCGNFFLNYTPAVISTNRDVYLDNPTFNGTSGTGWGVLSSRPTTCTPGQGGTFYVSPTGSYGVGYFATDTNTLYVCTATNTWTAIYTPYTYPHPLVTGGGGSTLNPPTISPVSGSYSSPQTVTITPPSGATACYTTNGSAPSASTPGTCDAESTTYSGPFSLAIPTGGAVVEAIATESGQTTSSVATASYSLQTCLQTQLGANWSCVSDATDYTSASGTQLTAGPFSVNPQAGSLILVFQFNGSSAACQAPTDTLGTSFTAISTATVAADSLALCDWYGVLPTSGADAVTCNAAATAAGMGCDVANVSGQSDGQIVDQTCTRSNALSDSGINNMNCANSIDVGAPNELVVAAAYGDFGARSAGANFTMIDPNNWSGEYFMEATPLIWTPSETMSASGLNYGFLAVTLEPYTQEQTPKEPTGLAVTVR